MATDAERLRRAQQTRRANYRSNQPQFTNQGQGYTPLPYNQTGRGSDTYGRGASRFDFANAQNQNIQRPGVTPGQPQGNGYNPTLDAPAPGYESTFLETPTAEQSFDVAAPDTTRPGLETTPGDQYVPPTDPAPGGDGVETPGNGSGWDTGAAWVTAGGNLMSGYAALEGVDIARDQYGLAKSTANRNFQAQAAALGNEIGNDEYSRLRRRGASEEDARAGATSKVAGANLPTNLTGGSFQWT